MIPKTIHYCWFGGNKKSDLAARCIKSWGTYCPEYKIVEWNEDNFNIDSAPTYVKQAYASKKWAFVTDYVRLYVMYNYGGIYMDTDVELLKTLDPFLCHKAFSGFEDDTHIPTGIMAAEQGFPLFKLLLEYYDTASFINKDGTLNTQTNVITITKTCLEHGLVLDGKLQTVEGFTLYPKDYFCPLSYSNLKLKKTRNTVCVHWFNGSWMSEEEKNRIKQYNKNEKKEKITKAPNRFFKKIVGNNIYNKFKRIFKGQKND